MPVSTTTARIVTATTRILQLASAVIVAGIVGHYLGLQDDANAHPSNRFIYTEVVAGLSMILSLVLLYPVVWGIKMALVEFCMFILWIIAFGMLAEPITDMRCGGWDWNWYGDDWGNNCGQWKAALAFCFISAIMWLVSVMEEAWIMQRVRKDQAVTRRKSWSRV